MKKELWLIGALILTLLFGCAAQAADSTRTVTLTVNGSTAAQAAVSNEVVRLAVQAPGATAVWLWDGNYADNRFGGNIYRAADWNMAYIEEGWLYQEGVKSVFAYARYDDVDGLDDEALRSQEERANWEGAKSNVVRLTVEAVGQIPAPGTHWISASAVNRGDWLKLRASSAVDGAFYWNDIGRVVDAAAGEDGIDWFWRQRYAFSGDTVTFSTLDLEPGEYAIKVWAGAYEYQNNHTTTTFTVTEPASAPAAGLYLSSSSVTVGEPFEIVGYLPDNQEDDEMMIRIDNPDRPTLTRREYRNGTMGTLEGWTLSDAGNYTVTLLAKEGDAYTRQIDQKPLTVTAGTGGQLNRPSFSGLPAVLPAGQNLTGTLALDDRATDCFVEVNYCPEGSGWEQIARTGRTSMRGTLGWNTIDFPASLFERTGRYRIWVSTGAPGFQNGDADFFFLRTDESASESLTLKVNGGTEDIASWPSSTDLRVEILPPANATAVRLLKRDHWDYRHTKGSLTWSEGFGDGDCVLVAQMTTDPAVWLEDGFDWSAFRWEDLNWTTLSNTVRVHVESEHAFDVPQVTLASDSVHRGDFLIANIAEKQLEGEWYWADVRRLVSDAYNTWWEDVLHQDSGESATLRISTLRLEPGDYWLSVGVDCHGWESNEKLLPFTVLEPEEALPEALLWFSRDSMLSGEDLNVYAEVPGCRHMELDITWDRDPYWHDRRDADGESASWGWGCGSGGEYTFTLGYFGDGFEGTVTKTLSVFSDGALDTPQLIDIPAFLYLGDGMNGRFTPVEGAQSYHVGLQYSPDGEYEWWDLYNENRDPEDEGLTALAFSGDLFTREGTYNLWVSADAIGKDNGYTERRITVIDRAALSDDLVMTVTGDTDGQIYLHQWPLVTVTAPDGVTAVLIWNAWHGGFGLVEENRCEFALGVHDGGETTFFAQATRDAAPAEWAQAHGGNMDGFDWSSVHWTMTAAPVTVNVIKYGDIDDPEITFPNGTTVERGQPLTFTVTDVEHCSDYGVWMAKIREDGSEEEPIANLDYSFDVTTTIQIPTDAFEAGNYRLHVEPRRYGYQGYEQTFEITVTQSGAWTDESSFTASAYTGPTQRPVTLSAYAPGAAEIKICMGSEDNIWYQEGGDRAVFTFTPNWKRVYHLMAFARNEGEENWWRISDDLDIDITAENGALEIISLDAPDTAKRDQDWTFRVTADFKGIEGNLDCWIENLENPDQYLYPELTEESTEGNLYTAVYTVKANTLPEGLYNIHVYAIPVAEGYEMGIAQKVLPVTAREGGGTLSVSKTEVEIFENFEVHIEAPEGATAVGYTTNGEIWWNYGGRTADETENAWWDGEMTLCGRYTMDAFDENEEGFDWENLNWSGVTNAVTVTVNPPSYELEELDVSIENTTVSRGQAFVVTVRNVNAGLNAAYGASLIPAGAEDPLQWYSADDAQKIYIQTADAEPGNYRLLVSANAVSCYGKMTEIQVTVEAPRTASDVLTLPKGMQTIEEEAFAGVAAEKIVVPAGVTSIGSRAFADCPNLFELELPEGITDFESDALAGCGPVMVFGKAGSDLEAYAHSVDNLIFIAVP